MRAILGAALGAELRSPRPWLAAAALGLIAGYVLAALVLVPRVADLGPAVEAIIPILALTAAGWAGGGTGAGLRNGSGAVLLAAGVRARQLVVASAVEAATVWWVPALAGLASWTVALAIVGVDVTRTALALALAVVMAAAWGGVCGVAAGTVTAHPWVGSIVGTSVALGTWLAGAGGDVASALEPLEALGPRRLLENMVLGLVEVDRLFSLGVQAVIVLAAAAAAIELRRGRPRLAQLRRRPAVGAVLATMAAVAVSAVVLVGTDGRFVDLSASSSFTVDAETKAVLDQSEMPIELIGLYRPGQVGRDAAERLLSAFAHASSRVRARLVSPDDAGSLAADLALTDGGALVVASGDRRVVVGAPDEARVAAAVRRIVSGDREQLCFTTRAGERPLDDNSSPGGLGRLDQMLAGEGYSVVPVLSATRSLDDCDAVVVVAPSRPLIEGAVGEIHRYVEGGGRLIVFGDAGDHELVQPLLAPLGARLAGPVVADAGQRLSEDLAVVVARPAAEGAPPVQVVLHRATPVSLAAEVVPVLVSSEATWLERGDEVMPEYSAGEDVPGPLMMAGALEHPSRPGFQLVVAGDADVVSNAWLRTAGNAAWLRAFLPLVLRGETPPPEFDTSADDRPVLDVSESGRWTLAAGMTGIPVALSALLGWFFRRRRAPRSAIAAVVGAGVIGIVGLVATANVAAATEATIVTWGSTVVPVPAGLRVAESSPVRLALTSGTERIDAAVVIQTLPLDVEHLATLNGGEVTGRGTARIGGVTSQWVSSTNLSGYEFRDHVVEDEGVAILTRWEPGRQAPVREVLRGLSFRGRYALRTPITDVLELLAGDERTLPGLSD